MKIKSTWMRRGRGLVILGIFLVLMLQGCTTPLVNVNVKVGNCAPGERAGGPGLCETVQVISGQVYGGVTCYSGVACKNEGSYAGCSGRKKCTTVDQSSNGSGDCVCQCK